MPPNDLGQWRSQGIDPEDLAVIGIKAGVAHRRAYDPIAVASFNVATGSSPYATYACVDTWLTDFRADLPKIDIPVLVLHGTADRILPFEVTAARLPALIGDCTLVPVEGGPHNIAWTYPEVVNAALLRFIG